MSRTTHGADAKSIGQFLTDDELKRMLRASVAGRGERGFTTAEATRVASWANGVKVMAEMLALVGGCEVALDLDGDDEVRFRAHPGDDLPVPGLDRWGYVVHRRPGR